MSMVLSTAARQHPSASALRIGKVKTEASKKSIPLDDVLIEECSITSHQASRRENRDRD
jgi:hypothetical protein